MQDEVCTIHRTIALPPGVEPSSLLVTPFPLDLRSSRQVMQFITCDSDRFSMVMIAKWGLGCLIGRKSGQSIEIWRSKKRYRVLFDVDVSGLIEAACLVF